jgi:membrane associated rhomboid family serine protease
LENALTVCGHILKNMEIQSALAVVPLVWGALAVPLLNEEPGQLSFPSAVVPFWRPYVPSLKIDPTSWCFSENEFERGKWWCALTSIFVHQDAQHCVSNIFGLLANGSSVYQHTGVLGMYLTFLGGGVLGNMNVYANRQELQSRLSSSLALSSHSGPNRSPTSLISDSWNALVDSATAVATPHVHRYMNYCGSSVGVTALGGASFMFSLCELLNLSLWAPPSGQRERKEAHVRVIYCLRNILFSSVHVINDCVQFGTDNVSHSGHLTGFVFGCGVAVVYSAGKRMLG